MKTPTRLNGPIVTFHCCLSWSLLHSYERGHRLVVTVAVVVAAADTTTAATTTTTIRCPRKSAKMLLSYLLQHVDHSDISWCTVS